MPVGLFPFAFDEYRFGSSQQNRMLWDAIGMPKPLSDDGLWSVIELLLPPEPARPKGGRPRLGGRAKDQQ